jgi:hypothetical protein
LVSATFCLLPLPGLAAEPRPVTRSCPAPNEWAGPRGNPGLDARSPLKGRITAPRLAWKQGVGAVETRLIITPGPDSRPFPLPAPGASTQPVDVGAADWGLATLSATLGDDTRPTERTRNTTYADVLPDAPGLERLDFESGFDKPTVNGQWQPCAGRCYAWRNGAWQKAWETAPIELLFQALPLVGDFDADQAPEVAILPWHELLILDARTGAVKDRCRFTAGRSYGFFGSYDLDGDGRSEFVVQADFAKHIDVLGYRDGKLALLWQREIELDIANPQKILRVHPDPVADVDGDGRLEVLANLYNDTGDQRWHVLVYDGLTGATKADLPDEFLQGTHDLDRDGSAEMLLTRVSGQGIPAAGPILVRNLRGPTPTVLWQRQEAGWATWDRPLPVHVNSTATLGQRDVLCRDTAAGPAVVLRTPASTGAGMASLRVAVWAQGQFTDRTHVTGPGISALALDGAGRLLARCRAAPGAAAELTLASGTVVAAESTLGGVPASTPVVAWGREETQATVVVQSTGEEVVAFQVANGDQPALERWRVPGRVQGDNWPAVSGALLADLTGAGQRHIVHASAAPSGCARIVARSLAGAEVWHHDFTAIPGGAPVWNVGGAVIWQAGCFTDATRQDVLVTVRRSMMHSEETSLLSGTDGHELWHRDRQVSNRGVGGTPFATADYDGDGRDDLASLHPSILYLLRGASGQDLLARDASWEAVPAKPVYWGLPVAGEFLGPGTGVSLFFATSRRSLTGVIRRDGSLAWWDAPDRSGTAYPAFGDIDGDGRLEATAAGYDDGIRCYDTATGDVKWRLAVPGLTTPVGSAGADIDGDGREEALFTQGNTLTCLGTLPGAVQGGVRWTFALPATVGPPAIAAVDGSGEAVILLVGADGYVYAIR